VVKERVAMSSESSNPAGDFASPSEPVVTASGASGLAPSGGSESSAVPGVSGVARVALAGSQSTSATSAKIGAHKRETFTADELAIVMSHYDIGAIDAIQEFPRGSRRAPKMLIRSEQGLYLLKRRARGKDSPFKVAFAHALQLYLASKKFPLPRLIGTRKDNNSMLQWKSGIYELFEYIKGSSYDNSLPATAEAGKALALFHLLLRHYQPEYEPPVGSYHASRMVSGAMEMIPSTIMKVEPQQAVTQAQNMTEVIEFMQQSYSDAARRVNEIGLSQWPVQIVHADWHPGNMLFHNGKIVAVIDYDAARVQQRVIDVANGALQFSILGGGDDPAQWPDFIDESRFKRFIRGYDAVPNCMLSRAELRAVVWLMIEALIAESVIPIAATGCFARMEGIAFLQMVQRKVSWLQQNSERLTQVLEE